MRKKTLILIATVALLLVIVPRDGYTNVIGYQDNVEFYLQNNTNYWLAEVDVAVFAPGTFESFLGFNPGSDDYVYKYSIVNKTGTFLKTLITQFSVHRISLDIWATDMDPFYDEIQLDPGGLQKSTSFKWATLSVDKAIDLFIGSQCTRFSECYRNRYWMGKHTATPCSDLASSRTGHPLADK